MSKKRKRSMAKLTVIRVVDVSGPEHAELRAQLSSPPAPVSPDEWRRHLAWARGH